MSNWRTYTRRVLIAVVLVSVGALGVPGSGSADQVEMSQEAWVITQAAIDKQINENVCNDDPNRACHELCEINNGEVTPQGYFSCLEI